ncbi:MAG TPA: trigger factor [Candidatus Angelobacter sp.]|nr:trigger factor [Candidatus Angelobacter sp.]
MDAEKPTTENLETSPAETAAAEAEPVTPPEGPAGMEEACKREVSVEIPADVVSKQQTALVEQYAKQARLPGFRKGKVPVSVVRNRFAGEIQNEVMESLVPQYFREAVVKAGFRPVSQPYIYALEAAPGEAIRFKAAFEVLPEFELGSYQDIKVEKPNIKISDPEIEAELKRLQERQASFDPVEEDRGARDGEFAQVAFTATPKETAVESPAAGKSQAAAAQPVQMDEVLVEIGGANTIPEFSQNLRGAKPGGEYSFDVTYPQDFHDARLAGKVFGYSVKVNAVKKKTLPELNDDFAKELSQEFQTLGQLKERIREGMEHERQHAAEHEAKEKLIDQLLEKQEFSVPRAMVERQIDLRLERGLRALAAQGMRTEDMRRMDFRRLRAGQREAAVKEVKSGLLLEKIAQAEGIQVSDEDLQQEIAGLAQQMGQTPEQVREKLKEEGALERIRGRMRSEKALNFLYSRAG